MSILDDAIREHLELKRAHGADAAELKRLEDEAFGPPGRSEEGDAFSEAQTEFLAAPATDAAEAAAEAKAEPAGRPAPNITDLQEPPEPPRADAPTPAPEAPTPAPEAAASETSAPAPPAPEAPVEAAPAVDEAPPTEEEEAPAPEPPKSDAPPTPAGPSTEERHAIASQPTELFDVEADIGTERPSPSDEELLDSQLSEPRLAPADPATPTEPAAPAEPSEAIESTGPDAEVAGDPLSEDEDDFFSEQRLSDELNQALDAPVTDEQEALPELPSEEHDPYPATDEHEASGQTGERDAVSEHQTALETDEHETEPPSEEHTAVYDFQREPERGEEREEEEDDFEDEHARGGSEREDVLEDTPEFLEDAPEDDELWFEQKPPKDFDFDD
jgi:hypothetical protein